MYNFPYPPSYYMQPSPADYFGSAAYGVPEYDDYRWNWWNWWSAQAMLGSLPPYPNLSKQQPTAPGTPAGQSTGTGATEGPPTPAELSYEYFKDAAIRGTYAGAPASGPTTGTTPTPGATTPAAEDYLAAAAAAGTALTPELVYQHTQQMLAAAAATAAAAASHGIVPKPIGTPSIDQSVRSVTSRSESQRDGSTSTKLKKEKLINKTEFKGSQKEVTTLMLRNIPNKYCQRELLEDLESYGFMPGEHTNFFYLPIDPVTGANLGYAFVNFTSPEITEKFRADINLKQLPRHLTRKVIEVGDAAVQGLEQNQQYYSRSSAMRNLDASRRPLFWNDDGMAINEIGDVVDVEGSVDADDETRFEQDWVSTLMLRNLRNKFTQTDLLRELEALGFLPRDHIDFFYLPIDTTTNANLGYAFVNFTEAKHVEEFKELSGQKLSRIFKQNIVVVFDASVQGIQANWDLYIRSAPINSSDPLRRPLFWPKTTLKGRSEAWDGSCTTHSTSRRSGMSGLHIERSRGSGDASSNASSSMPPGLLQMDKMSEQSHPISRPPGLGDLE